MKLFEQYSKAGVGIVIILLSMLAQYFNVSFDEAGATEAILGITKGVGYLLTLIGQFSREDLKMGVMRK